jgi:hypothetical protein
MTEALENHSLRDFTVRLDANKHSVSTLRHLFHAADLPGVRRLLLVLSGNSAGAPRMIRNRYRFPDFMPFGKDGNGQDEAQILPTHVAGALEHLEIEMLHVSETAGFKEFLGLFGAAARRPGVLLLRPFRSVSQVRSDCTRETWPKYPM